MALICQDAIPRRLVITSSRIVPGIARSPAKWGTAERVRWLRLAASMFDVLYERDDTLVAIEVKTSVERSDGETG
jgi:hypothetical protein